MSPAVELRGINNLAPLPALTTASHSLIKHCMLVVQPYLYSWSSDYECEISLCVSSPQQQTPAVIGVNE